MFAQTYWVVNYRKSRYKLVQHSVRFWHVRQTTIRDEHGCRLAKTRPICFLILLCCEVERNRSFRRKFKSERVKVSKISFCELVICMSKLVQNHF